MYHTFINISAISWRSVLLVVETWVPEEIHRPPASYWPTLSQNIEHLAMSRIQTHNISGDIQLPYDHDHDSPWFGTVYAFHNA
jgi:hypothetical protein